MLEREERGVEGARERLSSGMRSVFVSVVVAILRMLLLFLMRLLMVLLSMDACGFKRSRIENLQVCIESLWRDVK